MSGVYKKHNMSLWSETYIILNNLEKKKMQVFVIVSAPTERENWQQCTTSYDTYSLRAIINNC